MDFMKFSETAPMPRMAKLLAIAASALVSLALLPAVAHAATPRNIDFSTFAGSSDTATVTGVDLTGDHKNDTLTVKPVKVSSDWCKAAKVYVNGKLKLTVRIGSGYNFYGVRGNVVVTKTGRAFLYMHPSMDNDDGPDYVYTWKGGNLKKLVDLDKTAEKIAGHNYSDVAPQGKYLAVTHTFMSNGTGGFGAKYLYKYKGGKLVRASKAGKFATFGGEVGPTTLHANKALRAYSSKKCSGVSFKVKSGQEVTATKVYIDGSKCSICIVTSSGNKGWVKVPSEYPGGWDPMSKRLFTEFAYAG